MTEDTIYSEMLEVFQQETGYEMNTEADLAVRLRAAAAQIMSLYNYADYVYRQAFPQTAQGENLDRHGNLRGVERVAGAKAQGTLTFGVSAALAVDLQIQQGTVCLSSEGAAFETLEEASLPAGSTSVDVAAEALEEGVSGNAVAGSIIKMQTAPDGIETVTNKSAFNGGREQEDDETYRARILAAYMGLSNGTNIAYYTQLALSVAGIDRVKVIPCVSGAGTVGILVSSDAGVVTDEALEELTTLLKDRTELGITVTVSTPEAVPVAVTAQILPASGYTLAHARDAVKEAIKACFMGDRMGKNLYLSQLSHSAMDTGTIDNIVITTPIEDVVVEGTQQPVLESLTLEGM